MVLVRFPLHHWESWDLRHSKCLGRLRWKRNSIWSHRNKFLLFLTRRWCLWNSLWNFRRSFRYLFIFWFPRSLSIFRKNRCFHHIQFWNWRNIFACQNGRNPRNKFLLFNYCVTNMFRSLLKWFSYRLRLFRINTFNICASIWRISNIQFFPDSFIILNVHFSYI